MQRLQPNLWPPKQHTFARSHVSVGHGPASHARHANLAGWFHSTYRPILEHQPHALINGSNHKAIHLTVIVNPVPPLRYTDLFTLSVASSAASS